MAGRIAYREESYRRYGQKRFRDNDGGRGRDKSYRTFEDALNMNSKRLKIDEGGRNRGYCERKWNYDNRNNGNVNKSGDGDFFHASNAKIEERHKSSKTNSYKSSNSRRS